jgi:hypothetical protein
VSRGHCLQTIECVTNKHFIGKRLARAVVSTLVERVILNNVFNPYQFRWCAGASVFSKSNVIVYPILFVYDTLTFHWDALLLPSVARQHTILDTWWFLQSPLDPVFHAIYVLSRSRSCVCLSVGCLS